MSSTEQPTTVANSDVVTKYKVAGDIASKALATVLAQAVAGAKIVDLCKAGDEVLLAETAKVFNNKKVTKGIAFPTTVSPNDVVAHLAPLPTDKEAEITLKEGDVVKITLGAHIDGFPSVLGRTVVVGGESAAAPEVQAALAAAYWATEAALRTVKPGNKNWDVTKVVDTIAKEFGAVPLEGQLSQEHGKDTVDGKKKIILNPSDQQRKDFETVTFAENEVYGLDILLTPGTTPADGKSVAKQTQTTVYKKASRTYQLKLKTSRAAISEIQKKAGTFPFNIGILEDQRRARMALQEPLNHGLVDALDVNYTKTGQPVVGLFTTFAVTKNGILKLAAPAVEAPAKKIADAELAALVEQPLKKAAAKPAAA